MFWMLEDAAWTASPTNTHVKLAPRVMLSERLDCVVETMSYCPQADPSASPHGCPEEDGHALVSMVKPVPAVMLFEPVIPREPMMKSLALLVDREHEAEVPLAAVPTQGSPRCGSNGDAVFAPLMANAAQEILALTFPDCVQVIDLLESGEVAIA